MQQRRLVPVLLAHFFNHEDFNGFPAGDQSESELIGNGFLDGEHFRIEVVLPRPLQQQIVIPGQTCSIKNRHAKLASEGLDDGLHRLVREGELSDSRDPFRWTRHAASARCGFQTRNLGRVHFQNQNIGQPRLALCRQAKLPFDFLPQQFFGITLQRKQEIIISRALTMTCPSAPRMSSLQRLGIGIQPPAKLCRVLSR